MRFFGRLVQEPYDPQLEFISKRIINVVCQYIGVRQSCYLLEVEFGQKSPQKLILSKPKLQHRVGEIFIQKRDP